MDKWRKSDDFFRRPNATAAAPVAAPAMRPAVSAHAAPPMPRQEPPPQPYPDIALPLSAASPAGTRGTDAWMMSMIANLAAGAAHRPQNLGAVDLPGLWGSGQSYPFHVSPPKGPIFGQMQQGWLSGPIERYPSAFLPGFFGSTAMDESGWYDNGLIGGGLKKYIQPPPGGYLSDGTGG